MKRIWLDVPFEEKEEAKDLGAQWAPAAQRWFAPRPGMQRLERWAALPEVPNLLPGEDRVFGSGLLVDHVPSTCWFTNVRSCVSPKDWERLQRMITRRAGMRCETCGATKDRETRRWLEAHERWAFDETTGVQRLIRLICLCTDCHMVTHFGFAQARDLEDVAYLHLKAVTGMDQSQAYRHVQGAFALWQERSSRTWELDLSMLTDAGVTVQRPPMAKERPALAQEASDAQDDAIRQRAAERATAEGSRQPALAPLSPLGEAVNPLRRPMPGQAGSGTGPGSPTQTKSWLSQLVGRLRRT